MDAAGRGRWLAGSGDASQATVDAETLSGEPAVRKARRMKDFREVADPAETETLVVEDSSSSVPE